MELLIKNSDREGRQTLGFESFGVGFRVDVTDPALAERVAERLRTVFAGEIRFGNPENPQFRYSVISGVDGNVSLFDETGGVRTGYAIGEFVERFGSLIRIKVAENAPSRLFVHAGVVSKGGLAIILPGKTFSGKTTLVAELLKHDTVYYSDEYAIIDEQGMVHPFARPLSIRHKDGTGMKSSREPSEFGMAPGQGRIRCGMVLITEYRKGVSPRFKLLSPGEGILEILANTVPVRKNPEFSFKVLNKLIHRAIIAKCFRGEADRFASTLLEFFDKKVDAPH